MLRDGYALQTKARREPLPALPTLPICVTCHHHVPNFSPASGIMTEAGMVKITGHSKDFKEPIFSGGLWKFGGTFWAFWWREVWRELVSAIQELIIGDEVCETRPVTEIDAASVFHTLQSVCYVVP